MCAGVPASDDVTEEIARKELYKLGCLALTDRERKIVALVKQGYGWCQIGKLFGVAADAARMVHRRAIYRVHSELRQRASF